jgi:hypothetical protein
MREYGDGAQCDLCDQPIAGDKIEYDVTLPRSDKRLRFYIACHFAWQRECALQLRICHYLRCKPEMNT